MRFPPVLAIHVHEVTTGVVVVVAFIALGLALVGHQAWRASANRNLAFVTAAFGVFALKNAFTAWAVWTAAVKHEHLADHIHRGLGGDRAPCVPSRHRSIPEPASLT